MKAINCLARKTYRPGKPFPISGKAMDETRAQASRYALLATVDHEHLNDLGNGYIRELMRQGVTYLDYEELYFSLGQRGAQEYVLRTVKEKDIDVLLYMAASDDFHFSIEFFSSLRKHVFTAIVLGDTDHFFALRDIYYAQCMGLVIVYDCFSRYQYHQHGIQAVSFYSSYDPTKYRALPDIAKDIEVSFVGNLALKHNRREYLESVRRNGFQLSVFGYGSGGGSISLDAMVQLINRSKINLNFAGIAERNALRREPRINLRRKQIKGRITEIAMCGGFVLTEYAPGLEEVYEIGKEIAVFRDTHELNQKLDYYLRHEEERQWVARNGHGRALKDYDVTVAIPRLLQQIERYRKRQKPRPADIYIDPHFMRYYSTFRIAMIVQFVKRRQWRMVMEELAVIWRTKHLDLYMTVKYLSALAPRLRNLFKSLARGETYRGQRSGHDGTDSITAGGDWWEATQCRASERMRSPRGR